VDAQPLLIATIAATFFVAGVVKGVIGMGLPTFAMGVLGALISPVAAATLLIVPSLVTNIWQLLAGPNVGAIVRRLGWMMLAIIVATVAATSLLTNADARLSSLALGATLIIYAVYTLVSRPRSVPTTHESWLSPLVGAATGAVTGATGVFVIPAVPYLQALGLQKDDLVQALGLSFTVSTIALTAGLAWRGQLQVDHVTMSTLATVPAIAGMWCGQALRDKISPATFRRVFLGCLLLLGAEMVAEPLFAASHH
jgi:uncharacterized protein